MNNYKFTLTTESMLLTGSGEGGVMINVDVVFHPTGFPIIPARRIKGLLKESLQEVLDMYGEDYDMVEQLFGKSGEQVHTGKLLFRNLFVPGWEQIGPFLAEKHHEAFQPYNIQSFYTAEIQQTAIGLEDIKQNGRYIEQEGIAKDHSLRNYRVIRPDQTFEAIFHATEELNKKEEEYLQKAAVNLRYAGTRRNRGFGKIRCGIKQTEEVEQISVVNPGAIPVVKHGDKIAITIKTLSPVVLAQQLGEQNTVFTRKYIPGNRIRGLLANAFIRANNMLNRKNAHENDAFRDMFLLGDLKFGDLLFENTQTLPLHLQKLKVIENDSQKSLAFSAFDLMEEKDPPQTRPVGAFGTYQAEDDVVPIKPASPDTTFFFHNSRENRAAGRNVQENDGGIFYYEALKEDQVFNGTISGEPTGLNALLRLFPEPFTARMGRSKTAQYGEVEVTLAIAEDRDRNHVPPADLYVLTLQSPLVLLNENGIAVPDSRQLLNALNKQLEVELQLKQASAALCAIEQYNTVWASKSGKHTAYKEGSSFLLELKKGNIKPGTILESLGEWNHQGFGRVNLAKYEKSLNYYIPETNSGPGKTEVKGSTGIDILDEIKQQYERAKTEVEIKEKAIKQADQYQLNNHQISRLERLFITSEDAEAIHGWIKEACFKYSVDSNGKKNKRGNKPLGDSLQKAGLLDDNGNFKLDISDDKNDFSLQKIYWSTILQTLRKKNKAHDKAKQ